MFCLGLFRFATVERQQTTTLGFSLIDEIGKWSARNSSSVAVVLCYDNLHCSILAICMLWMYEMNYFRVANRKF